MNYIRGFFFVFLLIFISQVSCSSSTELNGEIFVVTQGAGNYKLGAIEVLAIPESQFMEFALAKKGEKEPLLKKLKDKIAECETYGVTRIEELRYQFCRRETEQAKGSLGDIYFAGLPNSVSSATTNGDGKFTLKLQSRGKYFIITRASRDNGRFTEQYFWFIPFEAKDAQQNLVVSNNNIYQPETAPF